MRSQAQRRSKDGPAWALVVGGAPGQLKFDVNFFSPVFLFSLAIYIRIGITKIYVKDAILKLYLEPVRFDQKLAFFCFESVNPILRLIYVLPVL